MCNYMIVVYQNLLHTDPKPIEKMLMIGFKNIRKHLLN